VLKPLERSSLFVLLCIFAIVCACIEVYLFYAMVSSGFTVGKGVTSVLNGGILFTGGRVFLKVLSKTFLEPDAVISFNKLHRFASDRCRVLDADGANHGDEYSNRQRLVTEILSFAESCLRGWVPGTHFELCVFIDAEQPILFAYFDTNHDNVARSMKNREQNPYWYVENRYEVTKLLANPSSHPRIIQDTAARKFQYSFASDQQRKQLKSTVLWCFDVGTPSAIVVSSNAKNAFRESDAEVTSFVKFVGTMAHFDLFDGGFVHRVRALKPDWFER
jgi:hypothetical protein